MTPAERIAFVAHHEAGHAIVAKHFGGRLVAVSVDSAIGADGKTWFQWDTVNLDGVACPERLLSLVAACGGRAAQRRWQAENGIVPNDAGCGSDGKSALEKAYQLLGVYTDLEMIEAAVEFARAEADRIIGMKWYQVVKLAALLMEIDRMTWGISATPDDLENLSYRFRTCVSDAGWRRSALVEPASESEVMARINVGAGENTQAAAAVNLEV